jgi:RNA polymerase sigma factor (sigma-70 family)
MTKKPIDADNWFMEWASFKSGDMGSFQRIYDHFFDRLYQYGCKLTADTELVEDSIQELFLALYTKKAQLSDTDHLGFYLLKALKLTLYGKMRKEKRIFRKQNDDGFRLQFVVETDESETIEQEKIDLILKSLEELSPRAREIIYLKFYGDLSYQEIGEMLGMKPDSAKKQVYRTVSSLRLMLKDVTPHLLVIVC